MVLRRYRHLHAVLRLYLCLPMMLCLLLPVMLCLLLPMMLCLRSQSEATKGLCVSEPGTRQMATYWEPYVRPLITHTPAVHCGVTPELRALWSIPSQPPTHT